MAKGYILAGQPKKAAQVLTRARQNYEKVGLFGLMSNLDWDGLKGAVPNGVLSAFQAS